MCIRDSTKTFELSIPKQISCKVITTNINDSFLIKSALESISGESRFLDIELKEMLTIDMMFLDQTDILILLDPSYLSPKAIQMLKAFLQRGGSIIWFSGNNYSLLEEMAISNLNLPIFQEMISAGGESYFSVQIEETGESTLFIFQDTIVGLESGDQLGIFDNNGVINTPVISKLSKKLIKDGNDGIVLAGTTGESPTLNHDEHKKVTEYIINQAKGRVPVMGGCGSNSTEESIDFVKHAFKSGASASLLVSPYYNKPTQLGLYEHFKKVAEACKNLPVYLYNLNILEIKNKVYPKLDCATLR